MHATKSMSMAKSGKRSRSWSSSCPYKTTACSFIASFILVHAAALVTHTKPGATRPQSKLFSQQNNDDQSPLRNIFSVPQDPSQKYDLEKAVSTFFTTVGFSALFLTNPLLPHLPMSPSLSSANAEDELYAKYGGKGLDTSLVDKECLMNKCSLQAKACLQDDPDCRKGLTCTAKCLGDNACITGCFARYGTPNLDGLLKCTIEDNECIKVAILEGGADAYGALQYLYFNIALHCSLSNIFIVSFIFQVKNRNHQLPLSETSIWQVWKVHGMSIYQISSSFLNIEASPQMIFFI